MDLQLMGYWALPTLFSVLLKHPVLGLRQGTLPLAGTSALLFSLNTFLCAVYV